MIVCHCLSITDRDLKRAATGSHVQNGAVSPRLAGSCCGGCKPMVRKLLQSYGSKKPATVDSNPAK